MIIIHSLYVAAGLSNEVFQFIAGVVSAGFRCFGFPSFEAAVSVSDSFQPLPEVFQGG